MWFLFTLWNILALLQTTVGSNSAETPGGLDKSN